MQLEHCQQLLSMQQNQLESEDMIVKGMCETLKQYRFLLQGHNITTDTMISQYNVSHGCVELNDIPPCSKNLFAYLFLFSLISFSFSLNFVCIFSINFFFLLCFSLSSFLSLFPPFFLHIPNVGN